MAALTYWSYPLFLSPPQAMSWQHEKFPSYYPHFSAPVSSAKAISYQDSAQPCSFSLASYASPQLVLACLHLEGEGDAQITISVLSGE